MRVLAGAMIGTLVALSFGTSAQAADYHLRRHHPRNPRAFIGTCVRTRAEAVGVAAPDAPPAIIYRDGVVQAYDPGMLGHVETRPGDPIQLCLVAFTRDCGGILGPDLQPGRTYATGNLRTGAAWTLPDLRSSCARH